MSTAEREWVTTREAARLLELNSVPASRVLALGGVRRQELPSYPVRWNRSDVLRLRDQSVRSTQPAA